MSEPASTTRGTLANCQQFFETLSKFYGVLSIKLYRTHLDPRPRIPTLPCLDHEAMLDANVPSHLAAYIQDPTSGDLHELVFTPAEEQIEVDIVSTIGEHSAESHRSFVHTLEQRFPEQTITDTRLSWLGGEVRIANTCRAQVTLRDVLLGTDLDRTEAAIQRLRTIADLMEKESRVASWTVRTVMAPLAAAGVLIYQLLGTLTGKLGPDGVTWLRYTIVAWLGVWFLYYGLKAVQLNRMANRVWKRSAEYSLILAERRRLARS